MNNGNDKIVLKLQNEAKRFITNSKLIFNDIVIVPKEIEVYYYKEGEFDDVSVHRNELQQNNKNHFYVHRNGRLKTDRYKGGNRACVDFVISDEKDVYYSYLIRSAVINDNSPVFGPHNVLKAIKNACNNIEYSEIENSSVIVDTNNNLSDVIMSKRINLSKGFIDSNLRLVIFDNDFKTSKYRDKERLIYDKIKSDNILGDKACKFVKEILGYVPSKIK